MHFIPNSKIVYCTPIPSMNHCLGLAFPGFCLPLLPLCSPHLGSTEQLDLVFFGEWSGVVFRAICLFRIVFFFRAIHLLLTRFSQSCSHLGISRPTVLFSRHYCYHQKWNSLSLWSWCNPESRQGTLFLGLYRGGICQCRHCRQQCKIFASGVNFSIFTHFLCFFLLKPLKLGEIDCVKIFS